MTKGSKLQKPIIFNYHDYREYLKHWLEYHKLHGRGFSIRRFAKTCNVAQGYFSMIVKGERNLSAKAISKIAGPMKLTTVEYQYLLNLQIVADSKSQEKRLAALKKMHRYTEYRRNNYDEATLYKYLSDWLHIAIREMTDLDGNQITAEWIQDKLVSKIGKLEIENAIEFLIKNNYISVDEMKNGVLDEKHLNVDGIVHKMGLTAFHKQMFKLATESIDLVDSSQRWINGLTMAISHDQYLQIVEIMKDAKKKISQIDNKKEKNNVVYHTAFVAFPLTKIKGVRN